jgi:hypothetical protein
MISMILRNRTLKLTLLTSFCFFLLFWVFSNYFASSDDKMKINFFDTYWTILIVGIIGGYYSTKYWGFGKSVLGKALLSFTTGMAFQLFGQLTFSLLYALNDGVVPYPSIADIGYFGSIPLYCYGAWSLAKSAGARRALRSMGGLLIAIALPMLLLAITVGMFIYGKEIDWSKPLLVILDFGYPMGQAIFLVLALLTYLLSSEWLGGKLRVSVVFVVFSLIAQYLADSTFLYLNLNGLWGPGEFNDLLYMVAYFFMSYAILDFWQKYEEIKEVGIVKK